MTATFEERLETLAPALMRQAASIASRHAHLSADDIYQEVTTAIWEKTKKEPEYLEADDVYWITFAKWRAKNILRGAYRYDRYVDAEIIEYKDTEALSSFDLIADNQSDMLLDLERAELIHEAVIQLSESDKNIVTLMYQGYTQKEIAKILGVSGAAITYRKSSIRKTFAEMRN